ncbi:MAG: hypothetical protein WC135_00460 [Bacteroidales bacterium]
MEKKNLNDKIFAPINRDEMNQIIGGKEVWKYVRTDKIKVECPPGYPDELWDCYVTEKVWDVYEVDEKGNSTFTGRGYTGDDK